MTGIDKSQKSSIQLSKALIARLGALGRKGDTYEAIIERLLDGRIGDADDNRREARDESTWDGHRQKG